MKKLACMLIAVLVLLPVFGVNADLIIAITVLCIVLSLALLGIVLLPLFIRQRKRLKELQKH
ncbi:MAG: hypothetical protein FWE40_00495 [Oscillospiraceae bacterium]|nr:hypothetical protein [Oscillospiraceae bacterium]